MKRLVGRNITFLSKTDLDNVWFEYVEIVNSSGISNCDEIDDALKQLDDGTGPKKGRKYNKSLITDDERRLMVSRKPSNERKHDFPHHQKELNVSLNLCHEENNKNLIFFGW